MFTHTTHFPSALFEGFSFFQLIVLGLLAETLPVWFGVGSISQLLSIFASCFQLKALSNLYISSQSAALP